MWQGYGRLSKSSGFPYAPPEYIYAYLYFMNWGLNSAVVHNCDLDSNPGIGMWQDIGHPSKVGLFSPGSPDSSSK